jgi:dipeptidyl aminopeptidase/acylaminoacyl peptidase
MIHIEVEHPNGSARAGDRVACIVSIVMATLLAFPTAGEATLRGRNGDLAYDLEFCSTGCDYFVDIVSARPGRPPREFFEFYEPAFSPRGSVLAFVNVEPTAISIGPRAGGGESGDAGVHDVIRAPDADLASPRWSPSGRRILFERKGRMSSEATLMEIELRTARLRQIGPPFSVPQGDEVDTLESELQPDWASTGEIVLERHPGSPGQVGSELAVMSATGKHLRPVTSGHFDRSPSWSPDGKRLAFVRAKDADDRCPKIYTMRADGRKLKRISNGCHTSVAWSPDGTELAAVSKYKQLEVMPAGGGPAQRIREATSNEAMDHVDWQPLPR